MDLNLIGLFVEIVESRSLSAAARKLGMTRANISQRLKLLERETGAQLLRRSTRSLELTQAGHTLYDCGQRMLEDLSTARASIDSLGQTLSGRVRISVPTGFGRMFLGERLLEFARMHPGISLNVTFNNRIEDLIAAEVDVAVRITATPPLEYVARNICSIDWNLYASAEYVEKHGPINCPGDLEKQTLVASPYPARRVTMTLTHRQDESDVHVIAIQPALQSSDYPFLTEAVCQGMGIGLLPAYVPHAPMSRGLLRILPDFRVAGLQNTLYIVTLPNRYPSPATQALIDYLRAEILSLAQAWS
ncbi:LysR family transcriptional regulator [Paraburkholderia sp. SIMBA_049]|uniref:DNA-binding transcriptional regulator, LysR family n=2 Tax=Paraburkholderia TaxID=1822464 RepID=A0A7Z7B8M9_9BURK|nr:MULTISPECIES: LysR family transcriptional regulator [Paraburkholderia]AUT65515.1 LysR family transcriptional regulator [Paraburkholderia terrae]BCZ82788.1 LysR family transcriptional regulator [Paraburkholderia terrae]SDI17624.1 DNA-binding transcriptional regulator, LysR family [Paraburkholderia steynii]